MVFEHSACTTLTGKLLQQEGMQLLIGRRHGIGRVMEMALGHIGNDTPIHLSFDVDALDPLWAPSTGTPVRGGLTLREGDFIRECVHETGSLVAIVCIPPNIETQCRWNSFRDRVCFPKRYSLLTE